MSDIVAEDEEDEYNFSNKHVRRVSYKVEETEKEMELREIERKLVEEYTAPVFQDSLEGRTIDMKPVNIVFDETVQKCNYPKPALVS